MNDGLPPLREVIARHDLRARRSLGQNFLLDMNLTDRIARASGPLDGVTVIEVGPGPGGLTRSLLAAGAAHVVAVERDDRCIAALNDIAAHYPGRLTIVPGDALATELSDYARGTTRIVANLPYNIATPLLTGWLTSETWPPWYESLTLMFQKEVAQRLTAAPGPSAYGRLSVLCGWRTVAHIVFDIAPQAFVPPPKVTSSLVHLVPRATPHDCRVATLETVTAAAFGQRRKMLRQSLRSLGVDPEQLLSCAGLAGTLRAQNVDVAGFVRLTRCLEAARTAA
ncbi:MAG: 16S rRNA (adenine(1518)-N(6)/adenine(1519)-N(6))-dimethyltransferase RsmA [Alphaproteobacteria bacterium]